MMSAFAREPAFHETMPARYRQLFHGASVREHAAIVANRGSSPAHAEIWRRTADGGVIACLAAEDRAGLVSSLGTALATQSIDILSAQVFARRSPKGAEVIDFFWLRRDPHIASAFTASDLARVADLLGGLMTGELRMDGRPLRARAGVLPDAATLVRCDAGEDAAPAALSVETAERVGLFVALTTALVDAKVNIVSSVRASGPGARVTHRFLVNERDGRALDQGRRGVVQAEVLRVLEPRAG